MENKKSKYVCANCGRTNEVGADKILVDKLGTYVTCEHCGATFDVDYNMD